MGRLTQIKPHEVSRDLSGYSVMFYGTPKSGKTTIASHFPKALVFAFEKGYNAIPGIMAQPINSWNEFKSFMLELRDQETKDAFKTIIIDTVDIAYDYCKEYICNMHGVSEIGKIPYGAGYGLVSTEFDKCIRKILQLDYGLVLISHSKEVTQKDDNGVEYLQKAPTIESRGRLICERTCDIIGMSDSVRDEDGHMVTKLYLRETPRHVAGSRFKYMPDEIVFTYENLVNAINHAIDREAAETGNRYVTSTKQNLYVAENNEELNFSELMATFNSLVNDIMTENPERRTKIAAIIADYLGAGNKVSDCTEAQAPQVKLIIDELRTLK